MSLGRRSLVEMIRKLLPGGAKKPQSHPFLKKAFSQASPLPLIFDETGPGGLSLDSFEFKRTLGTGSYGRVMLAQHVRSGEHVAIKILSKAKMAEREQASQAREEKEVLAALSHPLVVSLLGTFQDRKNLYLVMEYVPGGELFRHLRRAGRFQEGLATFYAAQVVLALEHLHHRGIVYRDLKPENVLLTSSGYIKLADFGFAKRVEHVTWTACGTPAYISPEVLTHRGATRAVDLWALGVFLYELLAGEPPFTAADPLAMCERILACDVSYPPHFSPEARDLISSLLQTDVSLRLGNLEGGFGEIKAHPFFAGVAWEQLASQTVRAPFAPPRRQSEAGNFARYREDPHAFPLEGEGEDDPFEDLFRGW